MFSGISHGALAGIATKLPSALSVASKTTPFADATFHRLRQDSNE